MKQRQSKAKKRKKQKRKENRQQERVLVVCIKRFIHAKTQPEVESTHLRLLFSASSFYWLFFLNHPSEDKVFRNKLQTFLLTDAKGPKYSKGFGRCPYIYVRHMLENTSREHIFILL